MIDDDRLHHLLRDSVKELRTASQERRLSQQELGDILGLTRSSVANIEIGAQKVSLSNVYALCDYFGLEIGDVLPKVDAVKTSKLDRNKSIHSEDVQRTIEKLRSK